MRTQTWLAPVVLAAAFAAVPAERSGEDAMHFALRASAPPDEAVVEAPSEIRLWFTEPPQPNTAALRLLNAGDEVVETGDVVQDPEDAKVFSAAIASPLAPGVYRVAWRGMASDGHVARGQFAFTVTAQ